MMMFLKFTAHRPPPPVLPPPRPPMPPPQLQALRGVLQPKQLPVVPAEAGTPRKAEVAIQTSFLVHSEADCPIALKDSARKRRRSLEIIAEVGAKVKRKGSLLRDKLRKSLELTPGKAVSQEITT